jgi:alkylation response protein AidB-like acyl-CoA dehydrogenase
VGSEQFCAHPNRSSSQGGHLDEGEVLVAGSSDQIHRDALVYVIGEGTSDIQRNLIARGLGFKP